MEAKTWVKISVVHSVEVSSVLKEERKDKNCTKGGSLFHTMISHSLADSVCLSLLKANLFIPPKQQLMTLRSPFNCNGIIMTVSRS